MIPKLFSKERLMVARWTVYRFIERLGFTGRLALVVIFLVIGVFMMNYWPAYQQVNEMSAELADKKIQLQSGQNIVDSRSLLNAYIAQFPPIAEKNNKLNAWMQIAKQHGLQPDSVVYKTTENDQSRLLQPTLVDFSLYASYVDIQNFLNQLMLEMPFASIERLSLSKEDVEEQFISAHIQLKFYFAKNERLANE